MKYLLCSYKFFGPIAMWNVLHICRSAHQAVFPLHLVPLPVKYSRCYGVAAPTGREHFFTPLWPLKQVSYTDVLCDSCWPDEKYLLYAYIFFSNLTCIRQTSDHCGSGVQYRPLQTMRSALPPKTCYGKNAGVFYLTKKFDIHQCEIMPVNGVGCYYTDKE